MRFAIVFVSLLTVIGCNPNTKETASSLNPVTIVADKDSDKADVRTVAVRVTGMMCPHGCYPGVKSVIEKKNDVASIELTPQQKEDVIDNPVILVKYRGELNKEATTKAILEAGFEKVEYNDQ
jgi:copper chaperone CopZ